MIINQGNLIAIKRHIYVSLQIMMGAFHLVTSRRKFRSVLTEIIKYEIFLLV